MVPSVCRLVTKWKTGSYWMTVNFVVMETCQIYKTREKSKATRKMSTPWKAEYIRQYQIFYPYPYKQDILAIVHVKPEAKELSTKVDRPAKVSLKTEGQIKPFQVKHKIQEFIKT